jgi:hypothetical protein
MFLIVIDFESSPLPAAQPAKAQTEKMPIAAMAASHFFPAC